MIKMDYTKILKPSNNSNQSDEERLFDFLVNEFVYSKINEVFKGLEELQKDFKRRFLEEDSRSQFVTLWLLQKRFWKLM